jgi:hypothetical protein
VLVACCAALILLYIGLGRFVFHGRNSHPFLGVLAEWLTHPAVPFYLLGYALSVSMISLSYVSPLSLTIAFAAGTIIYMASAYLFQTPAWIYAGLFSAHMMVLAYFTIDPSGGPIHYITLPFLGMTWITSLVGYAFERQGKPASGHTVYDSNCWTACSVIHGQDHSSPLRSGKWSCGNLWLYGDMTPRSSWPPDKPSCWHYSQSYGRKACWSTESLASACWQIEPR